MNVRTVLTGAGCLVLCGAAMSPVVDQPDYTSIPAAANELAAMCQSKSIDLTKAMRSAREAVGGIVTAAAFDLAKNAESIKVTVLADGAKHSVVVNSTNGEIMSDDIVPRFPGEAVSGEWTETSSGLKYYDIVVGDGALPAGPASTVLVHYTGWLVDGKKFDSSLDRGQPYSTPLSRVIPGWTEGVGSMRVGSKRKLIIPYNLAYGAAGGRGIPPKATLIFDIELLKVVGE